MHRLDCLQSTLLKRAPAMLLTYRMGCRPPGGEPGLGPRVIVDHFVPRLEPNLPENAEYQATRANRDHTGVSIFMCFIVLNLGLAYFVDIQRGMLLTTQFCERLILGSEHCHRRYCLMASASAQQC